MHLLGADALPRGGVLVVPGAPKIVGEHVRSGLRIVAVVDRPERRVVAALFEAGADGVVRTQDPPVALAAALRAAAMGYVVVPEEARSALHRPVFTAREKQILGLVVLGASNKEISERLFVAESTVKMHMTNVLRKLEVRSRKEAVDLILDPKSGLGTGILTITGGDSVQDGYGSPSFE